MYKIKCVARLVCVCVYKRTTRTDHKFKPSTMNFNNKETAIVLFFILFISLQMN